VDFITEPFKDRAKPTFMPLCLTVFLFRYQIIKMLLMVLAFFINDLI